MRTFAVVTALIVTLTFAELGRLREVRTILDATKPEGAPLPQYCLVYWSSLFGENDTATRYLNAASYLRITAAIIERRRRRCVQRERRARPSGIYSFPNESPGRNE